MHQSQLKNKIQNYKSGQNLYCYMPIGNYDFDSLIVISNGSASLASISTALMIPTGMGTM